MKTADVEIFWWNKVYFHTWRKTPDEVLGEIPGDTREELFLQYINSRDTGIDEDIFVCQHKDSAGMPRNSAKFGPSSREVSLGDTTTFPELTRQLLKSYMDICPFIDAPDIIAKPGRSLVVYGVTEIISSYFLSYVLVRRLMAGLKTVIQSGETGIYLFDDNGVTSLKFMDCYRDYIGQDEVWVLCQNRPTTAIIECFPRSFKLLAFPKRCAEETTEFCRSHCPSRIEISTSSGHAIALCAETIIQASPAQLGRLLELKDFYNSYKTEKSAKWNVEILISPWKIFYQELFERRLTEERPCTLQRILRKLFKATKPTKEAIRLHRPPRDLKHFHTTVSKDAIIHILD
ncbi:hypothetical protein TRICI_005313 [Trichomonascus ciferrii]|uniref:Uncharacterized protein n=1 Tax=Trichomonascus ciferrii TaxID=44093 RepID=A0A642UU98_9ASCO|nr:hypothetical protein TRICI_005313 [Trichomonascus ciferrii]